MLFKTLLALVCFTLSLAASAAPIQYALTGEVTGTFTFDPTTNTYTDVSLSETSSQFGLVIWTLSEFVFAGMDYSGGPLVTVAADNQQLSLSGFVVTDNDTRLDLSFDPLLSQFEPSQVTWSATYGPTGTTYGTSFATPSSAAPPTPKLSFPMAGIIDGTNSYSTTVDGITMTIDNPSPNSLSLFFNDKTALSFGEVANLTVTLLSFDVSFDSRVWLKSLDQVGSIGTVTFSIVGNGVTSYGNTVTDFPPPGELPFVGGPLLLQPGDRYTFSAVPGGVLDGMLITGFNAVGSPACIQGDYVLRTQAEVDAFPEDCVSVPGSIEIVSSADITNVDGLSGLTSVGGYLKIKYNDALINLDGLSGLTSVGGYLKIKYNNVLTNCQSLAPVLGWPSGPPNDSVGEGISISSNGGTECDSVAATLASVSGPTQPVITAATGRDQSISLAFPLSTTPDALFPITGYEAECSGLTEIETTQGVGSPLSVGNLTNYREYDCTVAPVTRLGTLPLSGPVSAIAGAVPPSAPQITSIDPGSAEVYINVSVANDGGSPITGYDAYCLDGSNIYPGSSVTFPTITVSGLTPGETYICLATATNDVGTSSLSALSAAVTPEGPADTDGDGVPDLIDNCVSIANADQEPSFVPGCGAACVTSSCAGTVCVNH
ncbi:MAG: hypothetical protein P8J79_01285 [Halioglobus sp.]|nr:hypothetical protein [Halioglobus sp.]